MSFLLFIPGGVRSNRIFFRVDTVRARKRAVSSARIAIEAKRISDPALYAALTDGRRLCKIQIGFHRDVCFPMRGRRSAEGAEAGLNRPCAGNRQKDGSKLTEGLNSGAEKKTVFHADAGLCFFGYRTLYDKKTMIIRP